MTRPRYANDPMRTERSLATTRPLAETLERVAALESGIDLSARPGFPDEPGWTTVAGLAEDRSLLEASLSRIECECGLENRAYAGTALLRSCLWRTLTPAVAALLTERRLPDLRAENVALRFGESGFAEDLAFAGARFVALPGDLDAGHPDAIIRPSENAMLLWLRETLAESYLEALIPALRSLRMRRGTRTLWSVAADVCAEAFIFVGQGLGRAEEACALAERTLAAPPLSGPINCYIFEYDGGSMLTRVRNACCLYYKLGKGACFTCPRTSDEERSRRMAAR